MDYHPTSLCGFVPILRSPNKVPPGSGRQVSAGLRTGLARRRTPAGRVSGAVDPRSVVAGTPARDAPPARGRGQALFGGLAIPGFARDRRTGPDPSLRSGQARGTPPQPAAAPAQR